MGGTKSKPAPAPKAPTAPWRKVHFETDETNLKEDLNRHRQTRLSIVLIGHTGAGKSSLINSIYSICRGRIVDVSSSKSDDLPGVGTIQFVDFPSTATDLFQNVHIFDTMGFTGTLGTGNDGISTEELKAVCEGRIKDRHKFNIDEASADERIEDNIPKCVVIVVSAEELDGLTEAAKIAVITKVDRVCNETNADITQMFTSKTVHDLVKKATSVFGMEVNKVFPIVNFLDEMEVTSSKSIPILYALKFALNFASDRSQKAKGNVIDNN